MIRRMTMKLGALGAMALLLLVAFAGTTTVGCPPPPPPCVENDEVTLWAGQNIDVGSVMVWHDNVYLYVKYMLDLDDDGCGWYITESHLSVVVGDSTDHPQGKKNLKIGHFEFTDPLDEGPKYHLYVISWNDIDGFAWDGESQTLDIVAHAVVKKVCDGETVQGETAYGDGDEWWKNWAMSFSYTPCEYKMPSIPSGEIEYMVNHPWSVGNSYFKTTITDGGGGDIVEDTPYKGWCIDTENDIYSNTLYDGTLSMPAPGDNDFCKWSKVNWVLNNDDGYSRDVTQAVIWNIWLEITIQQGNNAMGNGVNLDSTEYGQAVALALDASDECSFRAFSGDWVAVIITPTTGVQTTIIEVDP